MVDGSGWGPTQVLEDCALLSTCSKAIERKIVSKDVFELFELQKGVFVFTNPNHPLSSWHHQLACSSLEWIGWQKQPPEGVLTLFSFILKMPQSLYFFQVKKE